MLKSVFIIIRNLIQVAMFLIIFALLGCNSNESNIQTVHESQLPEKTIAGIFKTSEGNLIRISESSGEECVVTIGKNAYFGEIIGNGIKTYINDIYYNIHVKYINGLIYFSSNKDTLLYYSITIRKDIARATTDFVEHPNEYLMTYNLKAIRIE